MSGKRPGSTFALYRRLLRYAKPYRVRLTVGIVAGLLSGGSLYGLYQLAPRVIRPFEEGGQMSTEVSPASEPDPTGGLMGGLAGAEELAEKWHIPLRDAENRLTWQAVVLSLLALPVLVFVRALAAFLNRYLMRWIGARICRDLRDDLFAHLQRQSLKFFGGCDIGGVISRCTNDTAIVEGVVANTAADATRAPIEVLVSVVFVIVFSRDKDIGGVVLVMLALFPACVLPIVVLGHFVRRHTSRALGRISNLLSRMHETFTGVRVVKAFNMEARETARFRDENARYFTSVIRALRAELMMAPLMEAVALMLACGFLVICYARGVRVWQILPIGLAGVAIYRPLKQLTKIHPNVARGAAALERVYSLLDVDDVVPEPPNPVRVAGFRDQIIFEGVGFLYDPKSRPVLEGIDVTIPRGSVCALVGETGSGKTTMANLLARFYDPTSGRVLLDGHDLRDIELASLRKLVAVVTQETILFNDTVAANIAYGMDGVPHEAIIAAAEQANAHEFIMADPAGYERVVGEKGFVLSGGERQRIALARAVLRNPPILILDEATSALDTVTEHLVREAIARVMQDRTVFAIAHRLSTVRHADQILLLDGGRIAERGRHEELYAADGRYRRLCDMQMMDA